MKTQKVILLSICNTIFRLAFYGTAIAITLVIAFKSSANIKEAFTQTNAYTRFVPSIIDESIKGQQNLGTLPLSDKAVQAIIIESFPANDLQTKTESVIDNAYDWLGGKTDKATFTLDFTPNVHVLADKLSAYAFQRLKTQPVCKIAPAELDPFTSNCQPKKLDFAAEQISLANDIKRGSLILPKNTFTEQDLPKNDKGQTLIEQYYYAPTVFAWLVWSPFILGGITLLTAGLIILLIPRKRNGIGIVGSSMANSSIFIALSPLFFLYVLPLFFSGFHAQTSGSGMRGLLGDVQSKISAEFNTQLIYTGLILAAIGFLIMFFARLGAPGSRYSKVAKKAGLMSSNPPKRLSGMRARLNADSVPVQTSEGKRNRSSTYSRSTKYRKIPRREI